MNLTIVADEVTAAGWRLAGARAYIPEPGRHEQCFRDALNDADMVLITAREAENIPSVQLQAALRAQKPLLLLIPDMLHGQQPADLEREVARALGVAP